MEMKTLYIIDMMNLVMRNYHAFAKHGLYNDQGEPTGAIYGTCGFILSMLNEKKPDHIVVAKESPDDLSWRKDLYAGYKANREGRPEDMGFQYDEIIRFFDILGVKHISESGNEADDVVGALTHKFENDAQCFIVSGDKDFMQLVNRNTSLLIPKTKGKYIVAREKDVLEKFGCAPDKVQDVLALMGDKVDCVPGVTGIGPKGAAKLINEFGSVDGVYENLEKIGKNHKEKLEKCRREAFISHQLVGLNRELELGGLSLGDLSLIRKPDMNRELYDFLVSHNMDSLAEKYTPQFCGWV